MDMKLEVVVMPVSDVDRAKAFYEQVGFHPDVDHRAGDDLRVVQLTPPGSACSVTIGTGITDAPPRVHQGLHLVVSDIGHPGPISSPEVSRSASSSTSAPRAGSRGPIPSAAITAPTRRRATPTATRGLSRRCRRAPELLTFTSARRSGTLTCGRASARRLG